MSKIPSIISHNGAFHADDAMGVAILKLLHPSAVVLRSRDPKDWESADFLVDVGGSWAPELGRFDHHQASFLAQEGSRRASGVAYASAGLVWLRFGQDVVRRLAPSLDEPAVARVTALVDDELMQFLDQVDNGDAQVAPGLYGLSALLAQLVPTWDELATHSPEDQTRLQNQSFTTAVNLCGQFLQRIVAQAQAREVGAALVRAGERLANGRVLSLSQSRLPWESVVITEMPDVLFVVYPDSTDSTFQVRAVPQALHSFVARKDLPREWAGLRDADLASVSAVPSASFCHVKRFICGAYSQEGAQAMAIAALA